MPSLIEEIADALALDVIRAAQELGGDDLMAEIASIIGPLRQPRRRPS